MKFLFLIFVSLVYCETVCEIPIIFHKFDNCPNITKLPPRRATIDPDYPDDIQNYWCNNEGSCKNTGFQTNTKTFNELIEETYVRSGRSYEAFCTCKIRTAELLIYNQLDENQIEFQINNIWLQISNIHKEQYVLISITDGITLETPLEFEHTFIDEPDFFHIFILFEYDEETGLINLKLYINKEYICNAPDLLQTSEIFFQILSSNAQYYHIALFGVLLDIPTIEQLTDVGIDREASDEICYEMDDFVSVQQLKESKYGLHNLVWILPIIMSGVLIITGTVAVLLTMFRGVTK